MWTPESGSSGAPAAKEPRSFSRNPNHPDATAQDGKTFTSKRASLMPQDIYIHSDMLNATRSHGPKQESSVKLPVAAGYDYALPSGGPQFMARSRALQTWGAETTNDGLSTN